MGFVLPTLLWGLLLGFIPVLIHLLLRPRPRRLRFPALRLMHDTLSTGQRAHRVHNLLLLLTRTGLLGAAVVLLAGPTCRGGATAIPGEYGPIACVAILDDSLSTRARQRFDSPSTLLDLSRERALHFVQAATRWPAGSALALLHTSATQHDLGLTADFQAVHRAVLQSVAQSGNARPLGAALRGAAGLLRPAAQPRRQVVVFTDHARSAWRDVEPALLAGIDALTLRVITPVEDPRRNLGLTSAATPAQIQPAGAPVPLRVSLHAAGVDTRAWLLARDGTELFTRLGPYDLAVDERRAVTLPLPARGPGVYRVTLSVEPADLLPFDQDRHVTWQVGARPQVWLVSPSAAEDLTALILRNLLAPEVLPETDQRLTVSRLSPDTLAGTFASETPAPALILLLPEVNLDPPAERALLRTVQAGATLLLVPASDPLSVGWPGLQQLLCASSPVVEQLPGAMALRWAMEVNSPDWRPEYAELARAVIERRVRVGELAPGARALARYPDALPAVVERRYDQGRVLMLTTSPDPDWSDLGGRAAGLLTWLHRLVDETLGVPPATAHFSAGQVTHHAFAALDDADLVAVTRIEEDERAPQWLRTQRGAPQRPWPTESAGIYTVRAEHREIPSVLYAVNWPAEEFDLAEPTADEWTARLGLETLSIERGAAGDLQTVGATSRWLRGWTDAEMWLAGTLLGLFVAELMLATRHDAALESAHNRSPAAP